MVRKQEEPVWILGKEATAILRANSGRENIADSYIRTLARLGKVQVKELDGRTNGYLKSDVESYRVRLKDQGKGDTVASRKAGGRRTAKTNQQQQKAV